MNGVFVLLLVFCVSVAAAAEQKGCVFLTGGSGYLGRNMIRDLVSRGMEVHAIGRSPTAMEAVKAVGAIPFKASLSDVAGMTAAAKGCSLGIHAAASVEQWGSITKQREINVQGTINVMNACKAAGVKRVVHVGTEAGCLRADAGPLVMLNESTALPDVPFSGVYSTTKNEAEKAALAQRTDDFEVVVVRPRLIWGADDTVVLAHTVEAVQKGLFMWFDGCEHLISTCHVLNVVAGINAAAERGRSGEAYFLTDGEPQRMRTFFSEMMLSAGVEPPTRTMPLSLIWWAATVAEWVCGTFGGEDGWCEPFAPRQSLALVFQEITVSDAKARAELGYKNAVTIEEGMDDLRRRNNLPPKAAGGARVDL